MNNSDQRFGVEEIRRIREEDDIRYQGMTHEEITRDIHERANEAKKIMDRIRREQGARQVM